MNLSREQEKFVKSVLQALGEWREGMESAAWVALGIVLALGIVGCVLAIRWFRARTALMEYSHQSDPESARSVIPKTKD